MRRSLLWGGLTALALLGSAPPASAAMPVGACPRFWDLTTKVDVRAANPTVPEDNFQSVFESVDRNDDDRVCVKRDRPGGKYHFMENATGR